MPKKIAILRFSALGDVAMLMPVLRIAKKQYPDIEMHIFTKKPFDQIFHLADIRATGIKFDRDYKGILGLRKLAKEIDQQDFDMILDMHSVLRTFILEIFCNKQFHRLDKGRKDKAAMIKAKNRPEKPLLSMHERYAAVFKKAGIKLNLHTQLHPIAIKKLPGLPCSTNFSFPFIGIAPFSAHQSKEYPLEKMNMVIREIQSEIKLNILLFGGGKIEEKKLNKLADEFKNVYSTAGVLSLQDQIKWMSQLKLMISMDSGNGHLAAAMGIPVITIWGVTHPYLGFQAYNQPLKNQLLPDAEKYPAVPVSIFGKTKDEYYANAIGSIEPLAISKRVKSILKN